MKHVSAISLLTLSLLLLFVGTLSNPALATNPQSNPPTDPQFNRTDRQLLDRIYSGHNDRSIRFEPNLGQVANAQDVRFTANAGAVSVYFRNDGLSYVWTEAEIDNSAQTSLLQGRKGASGAANFKSDVATNSMSGDLANNLAGDVPAGLNPVKRLRQHRVDVQFVGASAGAVLTAADVAEGTQSYYYGQTVRENVPAFGRIAYQNIYPGIDLVFYSSGQQLKCDWVVSPGADPSAIRWKYDGAKSIRADADGRLQVETTLGTLVEDAPFSYQSIDGAAPKPSSPVAEYQISGSEVSFKLNNYDSSRLLVIDPTLLQWSSYYGGNGQETFMDVTTDAAGNVYAVGWTVSNNLPTTPGAFDSQFGGPAAPLASTPVDAFMVKFSPAGARLWATYVGGGQGAEQDAGGHVAIDGAGNVIMSGLTNAIDFPVTAGVFQQAFAGGIDAFIFKTDANGNRIWGSYYGGSSVEAGSLGEIAVAVDGNNEIVIVGRTTSTNIPGRTPTSYQFNLGGGSDVFITKVAANGSAIRWATYAGGGGDEISNAVCIDGSGNIYLTGLTFSGTPWLPQDPRPDDNILNGADAFVLMLNPNGAQQWGTFYGGTGNENVNLFHGIAVDAQGYVYISGRTTSTDLPGTAGKAQAATGGGPTDGFVAKFRGTGGPASLVWATYIGGSSDDECLGLDVDSEGRVYVVGQTHSTNFPTAGLPFQPAAGGGGQTDGFLVQLSSDGNTRLYGSYIGGNSPTPAQSDRANAVRIDAQGRVIVAGTAGSANNFLTNQTFQAARSAETDGFVMRFDNTQTTPCVAANGPRLQVLALTLGTDLTQEYPNTLAAIREHFQAFDVTTTNTTVAATLTGLLAGKDILLIPEIEDPSTNPAVFTGFAAALNTFVTNGGTVIFTGTNDAVGNGLDNCIWNTGLLTGDWQAQSTPNDFAATDNTSSSFLANGLPGTFQLPRRSSSYLITSPGFVPAVLYQGVPLAGYLNIGTGRVILIGSDYDSYTEETSRLIANAFSGTKSASGFRYAVSGVVKHESCSGGGDGAINLSVTNAGAPLTYLWSNGPSTQDITGLAAGSYTVTVTGGPAGACTQSLTFAVDACQPCTVPLDITLTPDMPTQCATGGIAAPVTISTTTTGGCGAYAISNPAFVFEVVPPSAVMIPSEDESIIGPFPIGFDFPFFCENRKQFWIADNGFITFSPRQNVYGNSFFPQALPSPIKPNDLIAACWADFDPTTPGSAVSYFQTGVTPNRKLVVTYSNVTYFDPSPPSNPPKSTFQLVLYEDGRIDVNQQSITAFALGEKTQALESKDGTRAVVVPGRNRDLTWNATNATVRFTPGAFSGDQAYNWTVPPVAASLGTTANLTTTPPVGSTTYQLRVINNFQNCYTDKTTDLVADAPSVGGTIGAAQTVCSGNVPALLTLAGHTGSILRWERSTDCPAFVSAITTLANTATTLQPIAISQATCYRAAVKSGQCPLANSAPLTVGVDVPTVAGTVANSQTLCVGDPVTTLTLSGQTGSVVRWESSGDCTGAGFSTLTTLAFTTTTLQPVAPPVTTCYRAVVKSGSCTAIASTYATLNIGGSSIGGTVASNHTICSSAATNPMALSGQTGTIVRWESSTFTPCFSTSGTINQIPNTSNPLSIPGVTQTTCFRAVVKNGGCPEVFSAPVTVTVSPVTQGGTLGSASTHCSGEPAGTLTLAGQTGNVLRWETSTNCPGFASGISTVALTTTTLAAGNLTQTTCYRAVVQSGACAPVNSNIITKTIGAGTVAGTVGTNVTACSGAAVAALNLTGHTGSVVRWERSTDCTFATLTTLNVTTASFTPPALTTTTCFRAVVKNGSCAEATSVSARITVEAATVAGTVTGANSLCASAGSLVLTLSGQTGSVLRWESSTDNFAAITVTLVITANTLAVVNPVATTWYRAVVRSGTQCATLTTPTVTVTVSPATVAGAVNGTTPTVCIGDPVGTLTLAGATGSVVRWESSINSFTNANTIAATTTTLQPTAPAVGTCWRAVVKSGACASANATSFCITVTPASVGGTVAGNNTICTGNAGGTLALSGQTGNILRWESSTDCAFATPAAIVTIPLTVPGINTGNPTTTTCYRAAIQNGACNIAFSSIARITVSQLATPGNVVGGTSICGAGNSSPIILAGHSGTILRWESSTDNFVSQTTPINITSTILPQQPVSQTTRYRAVIQNAPCAAVFSSSTQMYVGSPSGGGTLTSDRTICSGTDSGPIDLSGISGTVVRWESSEDCSFGGGAAINTIAHTGTSYTSGPLNTPTCFRAAVRDGICAEAFSSVSAIVTTTGAVGGQVIGSSAVYCANAPVAPIFLTGQQGSILRWESSGDCPAFTTVQTIAHTTFTYQPMGLSKTTCYRAVLGEPGCPEVFSAPFTVQINDLKLTAVVTDALGCVGKGRILANQTGANFVFFMLVSGPFSSLSMTGDYINLAPGDYTLTVTDLQTRCRAETTLTVSSGSVPIQITSIPVPLISKDAAFINWIPIPPTPGVTYVLRYRVEGSSEWTERNGIATPAMYVTGLQNNSRYEVQVRYRCPDGSLSDWSPVETFITLPSGDCFTIPAAVPGGIHYTNLMPTQSLIRWNRVPGAVGYVVQHGLSTLPTNSWPTYIVCEPFTSLQVIGLVPGRGYSFRIRTNCENCTSPVPRQASPYSPKYSYVTPNQKEGSVLLSDVAAIGLSLYPNPSRGQFTAQTEQALGANALLVVSDLSGREVWRGVMPSGSRELAVDLPSVAAGLYLLRIESPEYREIHKLVIE